MYKLILIAVIQFPLFTVAQDGYVRENKILTEKKKPINLPKNFHRIFRLHTFFGGSGSGNQFAPTGYQYVNGKDITIRSNGGFCTGIKVGYLLSNKVEIELGYDFNISGFREPVKGGKGSFRRHNIAPVLKYKIPLIRDEIATYFYGGGNLSFSNEMDVSIEFPNIGKDEVELIYNPSLGLIVGVELEFYSNNVVSIRFGFNHNINHLKLNRAYHNNQKINNSQVHPDAEKFFSNSGFIYIGAVLNLKWKQSI